MNFFRRFYLLTYIAIAINNSSFASTAEYVEKMNSVGIRLSGARFLYKSPKKELWVDFSTDSTNYFLKYAPHVNELLVEDSVSADLQIRCKTKDGYWAKWGFEGFFSTDHVSILATNWPNGRGVVSLFQLISYRAELPFLGVPEYWDKKTLVDKSALRWSFSSTETNSLRESYDCELKAEQKSVVTEIEYLTRTNEFRFIRKIIYFDASASFPVKLICYNGKTPNSYEWNYTLELIGEYKESMPPQDTFSIDKYLVAGSRLHHAHRMGTNSVVEISDPQKTSIILLGSKIKLSTVRNILFFATAIIISTVTFFLLRQSVNFKNSRQQQ